MIRRIHTTPDGQEYSYEEVEEPKSRAFWWNLLLLINTIMTVFNAWDIYILQKTPHIPELPPNVSSQLTP